MEKIVLNHIYKDNKTIQFDYFVSSGISQFFSGKPFIIEYPERVETVPNSVAAVPFVCNVLPIIWLTNSELVLPELDKAFYDCIPEVKRGYETMFPESKFAGNIIVKNVVNCDTPASGKCAAFFSGGLDSVQTLVSHLDEKPDLISIWGSDIKYDNEAGWKLVHSAIEEAAQKYHLSDVVIHSTFREFDNEGALSHEFYEQLKDGWWHGVKHGIGLLGHVAPYAYLHGLSTMYIASSNCPADGPVRCASNPLTDNYVRFVNCKVKHDGFEFSRQDKVHNIVEHCRATQNNFPLHVCWKSQEGSNCCHCEKCYRTMAGLLAEGADPAEYGFSYTKEDLADMHRYIVEDCKYLSSMQKHWTHIQHRVRENKQRLQAMPYWKQLKWIVKVDFYHPEKLKMPIIFRVKRKLLHYHFH